MYWEYDSRIGRRWNVDPVQKVWESPYMCFSGNPILYSDLLGDEPNGPGPRNPYLAQFFKSWKKGLKTFHSIQKAIENGQEYEETPSTTKASENNSVNKKPALSGDILNDKRFQFLKVAGSFIGTTEFGKNGDNPKIAMFHKIGSGSYFGESISWCASFVNYSILKGNPNLKNVGNAGSRFYYLWADKLGLEEVSEPFYGSLMVRSNNGKFNGGEGHVAFVVGKVDNSYAQLGGNQSVPGSNSGTTVNVVLRSRAPNVKYFHFKALPKIELGESLFKTATKKVQIQLGTDR